MMDKNAAGVGNRIAPLRFIVFAVVGLAATPAAIAASEWRMGVMIGFDLAAALFLLSVVPLYKRGKADNMRKAAVANDANRAVLLAITGLVMLVILVAVAAELAASGSPRPTTAALVIATLSIAWCFSNLIYALHYAHLFYSPNPEGADSGGIAFPKTKEPDYWDFTYFAFTLGMTFQTSDVDIEDRRIRRVVTFHCLAAFVFNLGIIAFTINVLGN